MRKQSQSRTYELIENGGDSEQKNAYDQNTGENLRGLKKQRLFYGQDYFTRS